MQADVLDGGPDNREATGFGGEDVNLIGTLPHIAKQAFESIGRLNVPVHALRERINEVGVNGQEKWDCLAIYSCRFVPPQVG